jgi:hypothetical protein
MRIRILPNPLAKESRTFYKEIGKGLRYSFDPHDETEEIDLLPASELPLG